MAVPPTIDNTLGLLFVVAIITAALYGAGMLQGWFYFRKYSRVDHWGLRSLIAFILVCDTVQEAMICEAVYRYAVTMHDDPFAMTHMVPTIIIELFFAAALGFAVQQFYCYRIYRLGKSLILAIVASVLSFASLGLIMGYTIIALGYSSLGELIQLANLATALNTASAVTDISITLAMIYSLQGQKTGFKRTTDLLNRLIIFTFNTGILTSVLSVADVIALNTLPNTFIYMGFFLIRDRFYTNSILVTLNSRKYILTTEEHGLESIHLSRLGTSSGAIMSSSGNHTQRDLAVRIEKTTMQATDAHSYDAQNGNQKSMMQMD